MITQQEVQQAFEKAIKTVGLAFFKQSSIFLSNSELLIRNTTTEDVPKIA